ncbi:ATP-binding cassette domain-containing protein, partial [Actinomyces israelii]
MRIDHVSKYYGDFKALNDVSLDILPGQVVAVIGASGSGKSTLCRTINRLETIQEGSIEIDGERLPEEGRELARLRAEVGMVFQSFNLFPHRTVLDNI